MKLSDTRKPLSPMDRAGFVLQEARGYAMEAFPGYRAEGPFDLDLYRRAFFETFERFPRLRQILEIAGRDRKKRLYWREAKGDLGHIFEIHDLALEEDSLEAAEKAFNQIQQEMLNAPGIDLMQDVGMKVYVYRAGPERHFVIVRFNHILSDGRGMILFQGLWGSRYHELLKDKGAPVQTEPFKMPEEEGETSLWTLFKKLGVMNFLRIVGQGLRNFRVGSRFPVAHLTKFRYGLEGRFRTLDCSLSADRAKAIRAGAKAMGITVNDLSLAGGYHAILRFCRQEGDEAKRVTINSPMDIRMVDSTVMDNVVIPRTISLIPERIRDDRHLIATIQEELGRVTDSKVYILGWIGLRLLGRIPFDGAVRLLRRSMERGRNLSASLLLSNVGEIMKWVPPNVLGEAEPAYLYHGVRGQYPPGYITPLFSLNGTMILGIGYFEPAMTEDKAARFGEIFFEELERISKLEIGSQA